MRKKTYYLDEKGRLLEEPNLPPNSLCGGLRLAYGLSPTEYENALKNAKPLPSSASASTPRKT